MLFITEIIGTENFLFNFGVDTLPVYLFTDDFVEK